MRNLVSRAFVLVSVLGCLAAAPGRAQAADFVFIKNVKNSTADLNSHELKDFLQGAKKAWKNGTPVELILNAEGSPELQWLTKEVLGLPESVLMAKIKQQIFQGVMKKPPSVATPADCVNEVKKSAGAFCIVDAATAKTLPPDVVVLKFNR